MQKPRGRIATPRPHEYLGPRTPKSECPCLAGYEEDEGERQEEMVGREKEEQ
ncbi:hypothetical protein E2C01_097284 [Portunus trituberculatus]|uniref:Uncharacterized protein n=1 Tax=Portunus trituberculatus TaxID=210409 RepID=A0A5B7K5B3_PORTR|nr:hypothetical protein [Portunus trituberculatus]